MFQEYHDTETFKAWCQREKNMGFTSKACMGPKQVEIANLVFNTDPEAMIRARHIKAVFEANAAKDQNSYNFV